MVGRTIVEGEVREYLVNELRKVRGNIRKCRWVGRRGCPDEFVWRPGWKFPKLAELKKPGERPTKHQEREHKRLRNFHIEVWVLDSFDAVDRFLASR